VVAEIPCSHGDVVSIMIAEEDRVDAKESAVPFQTAGVIDISLCGSKVVTYSAAH